jgi:hypothetical protein
VDESIQVPGRLLDRLPHLIIAVEVEDVRDEVQRILVILYFRVQTSQVEPISQIVLINLAEVLIASGRDKLNPPKKNKVSNCPPVENEGRGRQVVVAFCRGLLLVVCDAPKQSSPGNRKKRASPPPA